MRPLVVVLALALTLAGLAGCAGHRERGVVPPLGIPLRAGATDVSFVRLVETARSLGYELDFIDPEYGVFGARSRRSTRPGQQPIVFIVQCYAEGRATLTVLGGTALDRPDRVRVPDDVRREAVALAQDLAGDYGR